MINGHGYPTYHYRRDCHMASKLVHVCDVYDALRTRRPYRDAWEPDRVVTYIEERAGTEFELEAATAFLTMIRKVEGGIQLSTMPPTNGAAPATPPVENRVDTASPMPSAAPPKPPGGSS
jgi:HD-GYP domain-containing protein (c-di-GMP phosphodiesterase class II)